MLSTDLIFGIGYIMLEELVVLVGTVYVTKRIKVVWNLETSLYGTKLPWGSWPGLLAKRNKICGSCGFTPYM